VQSRIQCINCPRPILPLHWLPRLPYLADLYGKQWYTGTTVQTRAHATSNSCTCTLRPGVRVNEPGTGRHSTVHSSTRDTLTFKSIFDLLASHMLRRDETSQTGVFLPNKPDSLFACLSQQTDIFKKVGAGCLHRRPSAKTLLPHFHIPGRVLFQMHFGFIDPFPNPHNAVPQRHINPIVGPSRDHYMPEVNRLYEANHTALSNFQASSPQSNHPMTWIPRRSPAM